MKQAYIAKDKEIEKLNKRIAYTYVLGEIHRLGKRIVEEKREFEKVQEKVRSIKNWLKTLDKMLELRKRQLKELV